ncbi:MAG: beta-ketoacyl synthase N-terminal-like domain-containing protein [Chitinophagales bacterium]
MDAKNWNALMVYCIAENIISPLGETAAANFEAAKAGISGVALLENSRFSTSPVFLGHIPDQPHAAGYSLFESYCVQSVQDALQRSSVRLDDSNTIFILSTTKGNIDVLEHGGNAVTETASLSATAGKIAKHFGAANPPVVVSNACISGVMALITAKRLLDAGIYEHAVVCGADVLSKFVVSGFQALNAMSSKRCRPFDAARDGINLGEGAATLVLSTQKSELAISILGGAISNDANHISGPSRTGLELAAAVDSALQEANLTASQIDFVSAHGTATVYNDEMESKAFHHAGLSGKPLNSLKGYFGHTLGAAGTIETAMTMAMMRSGLVLGSLNYENCGTPFSLNIESTNRNQTIRHALKTASGFGGCNAALVLGFN